MAMKIRMVPLSSLVKNRFQGNKRTSERSTKFLGDLIEDTDFINPLLTFADGDKQIVCDGHRRWEIAERLGKSMIPVIELSERFTPEIWFLKLNCGTRPISGNDYFFAWATAVDKEKALSGMRSSVRKQIKECIVIFGLERTIEIGLSEKVSPGVCDSITPLISACLKLDLPFNRRSIGEWVLRYSLQRYVTDTDLGKKAKIEQILRLVNKNQHPG